MKIKRDTWEDLPKKTEVIERAFKTAQRLIGIVDEKKPTLDYSYNATTEQFDIRYFREGWVRDKDPDIWAIVFFDDAYDAEKLTEYIQNFEIMDKVLDDINADISKYLAEREDEENEFI